MEKSVLIVDRSKICSHLLENALELNKYNTIKSTNADEAGEIIMHLPVGLTILNLDNADDEFFSILRDCIRLKKNIIITLSSDENSLIRKLETYGVDTYYIKPLDMNKILTVVFEYME